MEVETACIVEKQLEIDVALDLLESEKERGMEENITVAEAIESTAVVVLQVDQHVLEEGRAVGVGPTNHNALKSLPQ